MDLFSVPKILCYCDGITHRIEQRKSGAVKVVDLTLKIDPLTSQLASALHDEYALVKRILFKVGGDGSPQPDLRSVEFRAPGERQLLTCFASSDTVEASIALDQVKVTKMRARSAKDGNRWVFYLYASFGPLSQRELEYINDWYTGQRAVTFEAAQPSLDLTEDEHEADEDARTGKTTERPAPMFETASDGKPIDAAAEGNPPAAADVEPVRQRTHSHANKRTH